MDWLKPPKTSQKIVSVEEMRSFDSETILTGVPAIDLMERAGNEVFQIVLEHSRRIKNCTVGVFCGPGNNGGDGFVVARKLKESGIKVEVYLTSSNSYSDCLQQQIAKFTQLGGTINYNLDKNRKFDLIVDALLGTGQSRKPRGAIKDFIEHINSLESIVFSIDIPSGVNSDSGEVYTPHINAFKTICLEFIKKGLLQEPASSTCGELALVYIGIVGSNTQFTWLGDDCLNLISERKRDSHKGNFGEVFVIGGCVNYPGAPALSSLAALKTGAGLVKAVKSPSFKANFANEIIFEDIGETQFIGEVHTRKIIDEAKKATSLVIGPGLGSHDSTVKLVENILMEVRSPIVLDADGLNALSKIGIQQIGNISNVIFTPHPGEMSRLLGITTQEVQKDRYKACMQLAQITGGVAILKGASSVISDGKNGAVNTSGNPFMATPGSGDILAGIVGALLARGISLFEAAKVGVYSHGVAGDRAHVKNQGTITSTDIINELPSLFNK